MTRSEKVATIVHDIQSGVKKIYSLELGMDVWLQVEQERPNTFVKVTGTTVVGRGFSKVSAPDEWSAKEGVRIAALRAARSYVDNVDKWENLTNGE